MPSTLLIQIFAQDNKAISVKCLGFRQGNIPSSPSRHGTINHFLRNETPPLHLSSGPLKKRSIFYDRRGLQANGRSSAQNLYLTLYTFHIINDTHTHPHIYIYIYYTYIYILSIIYYINYILYIYFIYIHLQYV